MPEESGRIDPRFGSALRQLRIDRGLSQQDLCRVIPCSAGWLSRVEAGTGVPTPDFVRRCDEALRADGALVTLARQAGVGQQSRRRPGRPAAHRPAQLPQTVSATFVGRDGELTELDALLDERPNEMVTVIIDGLAGVGKTSLALRWARRIADRFPDGAVFRDLRGFDPTGHPADPEEVLEGLLVDLGVAASTVPPTAERRAALFRSVLDGRRVLLVLDNAATSEQVLPLLPGTPGCAVIVTSRRRLSGLAVRTDGHRVTLGPLDRVESVALLRQLIGPRAEAEPRAAAALADQCGHLPLALRIAGHRAASRPRLDLSELVDELVGEEQRLEALTTLDDVTVRAAFSWSYRDLDQRAARMFRLLGLYPGESISTGAAGALAGVPVGQARSTLDGLTNVNMLEEVARDRFRFHDLLRDYAAEQATAEEGPDEREQAIRRLVDWYVHTSHLASLLVAPQRPTNLELMPAAAGVAPVPLDSTEAALAWYDAELANLTPITRLATDHGLFVQGWQLPVTLWNYLQLRCPWAVWEATHRIGQEAARACGDRLGEAWVNTNLGYGLHARGEHDQSEACYQAALAIRQEIGDVHGQAWTLNGWGFTALDRGDAGRAEGLFEQALPLFEAVGDQHGRGIALAALGDACRAQHRDGDALRRLTEALRAFEDMGDDHGQGFTLVKFGELYRGAGNLEQALEHFTRSLVCRRRATDRPGEADSLERRGNVLAERGHPLAAARSWDEAVAIYEELGDPRAAELRERVARLRTGVSAGRGFDASSREIS
ncbi:tetratricopeptide repeat protein [Goodfellowiella coeruleoviolacea]|uniref:ATPase n=1 Tax=Goodfellowiella coeruleoviolacea TaxID=334858 RepID=A0AAE3KFN2_9PSEU|nr:tetratricopeptide repeat protein [Goodfellowiella coeruleoviolacea]MCP2165140.1 putative ATPase [Goodfellowiella coeruleoviolacea]